MKDKKNKIKGFLTYVIFFLLVIVVLTKILLVGTVSSGSMEPALSVGNRILISGLAYVFGEPERGDIILFEFEEKGINFTKRIIGLPGETITFYDGKVYVDGKLLREDYILEEVETLSGRTFIVPEQSYFVLGDNRQNSLDSRYWKEPYIKKESIKGKIVLQIPYVEIREKFRNKFLK